MREGVRTPTYVGVFLVTLATLMLQILLTRIFSVTMWYHFAFMAVSIAMFGITLGAVIVYLRPASFPPERARAQLALHSLLFGLATAVAFVAHLYVPYLTGTGSVGTVSGAPAEGPPVWLANLAFLGLTYAIIAVPFVFSGIAVCLALTRFPRATNRLYAADLAGAGCGCALFVPLLGVTDGPTAAVVVAAVACAGAWVLARDAGERRLVATAAACAVTLAAVAAGHTLLVWQESPILRLPFAKGRELAPPVYEKWNSFAYFRVDIAGSTPGGWGFSESFRPQREVRQLGVYIDAFAGTLMTGYDGDAAGVEHLRYDVTNFAHHLRPDSDVLVIGVGGGRDVLAALASDQKSVLGVEINGDLVDALTGRFGDFTGHLDRDPRVRFAVDEARSFVARHPEHFDVIQVSLIDTWAATAAGAFALTENSLYTVEAWKLFLERLSPRGLLSFSRWYTAGRPAEIYRLTTLASAALRAVGVTRPRRHLAIVTNVSGPARAASGIGTLLVARTPFSPGDLAAIRETADRLGFAILLAPDRVADPLLARLATGRNLAEVTARLPLDVSPPTDDRPFFFNMLRLRDALDPDVRRGHENRFNLNAVATLATLLAIALGLTILFILVPLALTSERRQLDGALPLFVFFGAIGLGFMFVEISQLQRLIVFLGHPTYSLSVVLFSLLLSSGLGSLLTPSGTDATRAGWRLVALVAALALFGLLTPPATTSLAAATTPLRLAAAVVLLAPIGLFMGMAFPLGMTVAARRAPALTPWLWGINGAASVCASVLAVVVSLTWGISVTFWSGGACYGVAFVAFLAMTRDLPGSAAAGSGKRGAPCTDPGAPGHG